MDIRDADTSRLPQTSSGRIHPTTLSSVIDNDRRRKRRRGAQIRLLNATVSAAANVGDPVGALGVYFGTGAYTFTMTDTASGKFAVDGAVVEVAGALAAGTYVVVVEADNGVDDPTSASLHIEAI